MQNSMSILNKDIKEMKKEAREQPEVKEIKALQKEGLVLKYFLIRVSAYKGTVGCLLDEGSF